MKPFIPNLEAFKAKYDSGYNFAGAVSALFRDTETTYEERLLRKRECYAKRMEDPEFVARRQAQQRVWDARKRERRAAKR